MIPVLGATTTGGASPGAPASAGSSAPADAEHGGFLSILLALASAAGEPRMANPDQALVPDEGGANTVGQTPDEADGASAAILDAMALLLAGAVGTALAGELQPCTAGETAEPVPPDESEAEVAAGLRLDQTSVVPSTHGAPPEVQASTVGRVVPAEPALLSSGNGTAPRAEAGAALEAFPGVAASAATPAAALDAGRQPKLEAAADPEQTAQPPFAATSPAGPSSNGVSPDGATDERGALLSAGMEPGRKMRRDPVELPAGETPETPAAESRPAGSERTRVEAPSLERTPRTPDVRSPEPLRRAPSLLEKSPPPTREGSQHEHDNARAPDAQGRDLRRGLERVEGLPVAREAQTSAAVENVRAAREPLTQLGVERVLSAARTSVAQGGMEVRLRLHPESLGEVRVQVRWEGGVLSARLEAATPLAREALETGAQALRAALQEQGIPVQNLVVGLRMDLDARSPRQEFGAHDGPVLSSAMPAPAVSGEDRGAEPAAPGRLDIRI